MVYRLLQDWSDQLLPYVNMGASQSSGSGFDPYGKPISGEDIPYTSYSIERQVLKDKQHGASIQPTPGKPLPKVPENSPAHNIVVVSEGTNPDDMALESELQKMRDIPTFLPIIKGVANLGNINVEDPAMMDKMEHRQLLFMCLRYQQHLKQCAEAVSFDQGVLSNRIKEVDAEGTSVTSAFTDRQRKFAKYAEQIQKINEMSGTLKRVQMNIDQLVPLMDRLNSILPEGDRLEPFSMKPESKS